jgi:hypothetical protein
MRGFQLTLALSKLEANPDFHDGSPSASEVPYRAGTLTVSLRQDAAATTAKAARSGYVDPNDESSSCAHVRRGLQPRMCRDVNTAKWKRCPAGWEFEKYPEE